MVYVGSYDGNIYALNAKTGSFVWSYATGEMVVSSPAIADNTVYVGSYNNMLYAFSSSSTLAPLKSETLQLTIVSLVLLVIIAVILLLVVGRLRKKK
jgi:outer membrane protein assembly factor BamB